MVRCLFYILLCAMLALNLSDTLNGGLLRSQVESVTSDSGRLSCPESHCNISPVREFSEMDHFPLFGDHISEYRRSKGFIPGMSYSRGQTSLRLLKFSVDTIPVRVLSTLESQLPQSRGGNLFAQNNPARSSCRYYLYTLQKILI